MQNVWWPFLNPITLSQLFHPSAFSLPKTFIFRHLFSTHLLISLWKCPSTSNTQWRGKRKIFLDAFWQNSRYHENSLAMKFCEDFYGGENSRNIRGLTFIHLYIRITIHFYIWSAEFCWLYQLCVSKNRHKKWKKK